MNCRSAAFCFVVLVGTVAFVGIRPADAIEYRCHLPLTASADIATGAPAINTSRDETIDFNISIPDTKQFGLVEGVKFSIYEGAGFLTLYGPATGVATGFDAVTVFANKVGNGFYSVESRHVVVAGRSVPSLSAGVCVPT